MNWAKIYYISQGKTTEEHLANISDVVEAGCKFVQLRLKGVSEEDYTKAGIKAQQICAVKNALLFINDNIQVAKNCNADGVHLGLTDERPAKAREVLSKGKLVGGTANTLEHCLQLINEGVDYIGLGPYRYTTTKKNLSPVLGLEGFENIKNELVKRGDLTPIYAIGGIEKVDFESIYNIGINGIAVSGILSNKSKNELAAVL